MYVVFGVCAGDIQPFDPGIGIASCGVQSEVHEGTQRDIVGDGGNEIPATDNFSAREFSLVGFNLGGKRLGQKYFGDVIIEVKGYARDARTEGLRLEAEKLVLAGQEKVLRGIETQDDEASVLNRMVIAVKGHGVFRYGQLQLPALHVETDPLSIEIGNTDLTCISTLVFFHVSLPKTSVGKQIVSSSLLDIQPFDPGGILVQFDGCILGDTWQLDQRRQPSQNLFPSVTRSSRFGFWKGITELNTKDFHILQKLWNKNDYECPGKPKECWLNKFSTSTLRTKLILRGGGIDTRRKLLGLLG